MANWLAEHRYVTGLGIAFTIAGAITAPFVFTELHPLRAALGGALFGSFCTLCVALPRFF